MTARFAKAMPGISFAQFGLSKFLPVSKKTLDPFLQKKVAIHKLVSQQYFFNINNMNINPLNMGLVFIRQ